jgi:hypothetical protein
VKRRSLASLRPPDRLAVDANPIFSALLGGQPRRVFFESAISEFTVPERVIIEVQRYVPRVARKPGVEQALLECALNLLPLRIYPARRYARAVREARRPLWSNDCDFEDTEQVHHRRAVGHPVRGSRALSCPKGERAGGQ